jgi:hypothetical protein
MSGIVVADRPPLANVAPFGRAGGISTLGTGAESAVADGW